MSDILREFQAAVRTHRTAAGMSPQEFGDRLCLTRQRAGQIENGRFSPHLSKAEAVAKVFGKELWEFLRDGKKGLAQSGEGH